MRFVIAIIIFTFSFTAFAEQPTDAILDTFFELSGAAEQYNSSVQSTYLPIIKMMQMNIVKMKAKDKAKADSVANKVEHLFRWDNIKPRIYDFYRKNYTAEEISEFIKTMKSPGYQAMRNKELQTVDEYNKTMQTITMQNLLQIAVEVELEGKLK